jgi:predicted helicase
MLLVKRPGISPEDGATIRYLDVGDYLTRDQKLEGLAEGLPIGLNGPAPLDDLGWTKIEPNEHGDWINQRSDSFEIHLPAHADDGPSVFSERGLGLSTGRDAWNYNSSRSALDSNIDRMIDFFNRSTEAYASTRPAASGSLRDRTKAAADFVDKDPTKFSWNRNAFADVARGIRYSSADRDPRIATYRPFHRRWAEFGRRFNGSVSQIPRAFPTPDTDNLSITVTTVGSRNAFATLTTKDVPDLHVWPDGTVYFSLKILDRAQSTEDNSLDLFHAEPVDGQGHNVTDDALIRYRSLDSKIEKDDIFFYVYGILHSPDYRSAFAADLKKSLPRIPQVSTAEDFWAFAGAGRELARLHTEYESVDRWPDLNYVYAAGFDAGHPDAYRVLKMKYPKITDPATGAKVEDRTRIVYNDWITVENVPERAYDYELGSRSAIGWVMEAWRVRTDKASGLVNDPNDWAVEHEEPTYILDLVGRVVTVSMRTLDIVEGLPALRL